MPCHAYPRKIRYPVFIACPRRLGRAKHRRCIFKPLVLQVGMVHHDELKVGCDLAGYSGHEREQLVDCRFVLVAKSLNRALVSVAVGG